MPDFAIERLTRGAPDMTSWPLALTGRESGRDWIISSSQSARTHGVFPGITASAAQALCSSLHRIPENPQDDEKALHALALSLLKFSPSVSLDPRRLRATGSLFIDIQGTQNHFGGERRLALLAVRHCAKLGYKALVALAPNPSAARVLTRARMSKGLRVSSDELKSTLGRLPWTVLTLDRKEMEALSALGFTSLGELIALPRSGLRLRIGSSIIEQIEEILGETTEFFRSVQPPDLFVETLQWWPPTSDTSRLLFAAKRLFDSAEGFLQARDRVVQSARLELSGPDTPEAIEITLSPRRPTRASSVLLALLQRHLERTSTPKRTPSPLLASLSIERLRLTFDRTEPRRRQQQSLFAPTLNWREGPLAQLCDRLSSRLGEEKVLYAQLIADHRPEKAYRLRDLNATHVHEAPPPFGRRPLQLDHPPSPLSLLCRHPEEPAALLSGSDKGPLIVVSGPERIESGWWDGGDVQRLYFEVQTSKGTHLWIFFDLKAKRWYRHGWFG